MYTFPQLKFIAVLFFCWLVNTVDGQAPPQGMPGGPGRPPGAGGRPGGMMGRFYGKVIDNTTGKGIEFAPVQLLLNKPDSATQTIKKITVGGQLTETNGDFSLENVPMMGRFTLRITALGYEPYEAEISFQGLTPPNTDKDLGNIKLNVDAKTLKEVVIEGAAPTYKMDVDKKVFNVEKNNMSKGGTAEDVMKNVPSVNIDIDGNLTLRNNAPQIFVDGRPTTLALNQIPADAIESVEVITNPSAKYDAEGGAGGIINIVMKKNRKMGYNGNARAGVDMFGKINLGLDLNVRQNKINFFISGNLNQRKVVGHARTIRRNFFNGMESDVTQTNEPIMNAYFGNVKAGIDYFIDNRNTLTFSQSYTQGRFSPNDDLHTLTNYINTPTGDYSTYYERVSRVTRGFDNWGSALLYKHLFQKPGKEITADVNYQSISGINKGDYFTQNYYPVNVPTGEQVLQKQVGSGNSTYITIQSDYVEPLSDKSKIEAGVRANIQKFTSINENSVYSYNSGEYVVNPLLTTDYAFQNQVYAAYATYTGKAGKLSYQGGLRFESSYYNGKLLNTDAVFSNQYPATLFPSGFIAYAFNDQNTLQLNYTRRINRPNFFQLLPYYDYSDSLNLRHGNPALRPEFTHSLELNYQHNFNKQNTFIASAYFRHTNHLITNFQVLEYSPVLQRDVIFNTFINAKFSESYGVELTSQNSIRSWLDVTTNLNLYDAAINSGSAQNNFYNHLFSWFGKINLNFKLPKNFSYQVTGDYQAKSIIPPSTGGGGGGFGGPVSAAQGYLLPRYGIDMAIRYDFLKNKAASLTLSCSDVFRMRQANGYAASAFFDQYSYRYQNQRYFRLNFSYRFGKFDASLFKRKNTKADMESQGM